jgi:V8-like Glu-specific endopeptidase
MTIQHRMQILQILYEERAHGSQTFDRDILIQRMHASWDNIHLEVAYLEEIGYIEVKRRQLGARIFEALRITAKGIDFVENPPPDSDERHPLQYVESSLWDSNLTNLKYVLADLYPFKEDSVSIVRDTGLDLTHISFQNKAVNNWSEILFEANKHGKVSDVIRAALRDYPDNQSLLSALKGTLTPVRPLLGDTFSWESPVLPETLEKLMGKQTTLLPISWLEIGLQRSRSVAKVKRADHTYGTGFLIRDNWFLTNHHVLGTVDEARTTIVQFNYQKDTDGRDFEPVNFELDPDAGFKTSVEHDWTLVRVKGDANTEWGVLDLQPVEIKVNDRANIIQHPGGEVKQIALYHNIIAYVDNTRVQYLTDTLPGSSGSAVFDDEWRVIALHHAGGLLIEPDTKKQVYRNEGINVNCILKDLKLLGGL